jgi:Na+:H+ antiporter, NhaA family
VEKVVPIGAAFLVALVGANIAGVAKPLVYGLLGIGLWLAFLKCSVHATIARVLLAMTDNYYFARLW